jgi:hypothetical protein
MAGEEYALKTRFGVRFARSLRWARPMFFAAVCQACGGNVSPGDGASVVDATTDASEASTDAVVAPPESSADASQDVLDVGSVDTGVGDALSGCSLTGVWRGMRGEMITGTNSPMSLTLRHAGTAITGTDERGEAVSGTVADGGVQFTAGSGRCAGRQYTGTLMGCRRIDGRWSGICEEYGGFSVALE